MEKPSLQLGQHRAVAKVQVLEPGLKSWLNHLQMLGLWSGYNKSIPHWLWGGFLELILAPVKPSVTFSYSCYYSSDSGDTKSPLQRQNFQKKQLPSQDRGSLPFQLPASSHSYSTCSPREAPAWAPPSLGGGWRNEWELGGWGWLPAFPPFSP